MAERNIQPVGESTLNEIVVTRVFDAPRELVWKAWTDPERMKLWWGPAVFTAPVCKIDLRVGGKYLFCMRSPQGQDYWNTGVYREIVPPSRLVYIDNFADEQGNIVPASHYGLPDDWPAQIMVTVTLEEENGKTKMTVRQQGVPSGMMSEMTSQGWNGSFDKLAASLKA
ncbi:MAG TPA: SRPBCC domain-containing protein [Candidatus Angelobacter sp.]|nr:SRPBCC domain-containing protein [Candidatus Angelobacter sp.]